MLARQIPSQPQPLALVITGLEPGGAERALVQLALRIDRDFFRPAVIALRSRPEAEQCELVEQLAAAAVPVEFLNCTRKWQFPLAVWRLGRCLRRLRPAIVQSFLFHANVVAALAGKLSGVQVVAGVRVADPNRSRQRTERWIAPLVERFVCVSQSVADFCERNYPLPRTKLLVIPNGVDVARFRDARCADPAVAGLPVGRRFLIAIGRLDQQKGHDWLLSLLPRIFAERLEYDLILVGDGPAQARLQAQARELQIAERIHFLGWRADVPELLKLADVLLLPSRWEGMPNVLLEAMAAGLPVVTTAVEGVAEILGPLAPGQQVPVGDSAGFAERTLALTAAGDLLLQVGEANQQRVLKEFSLALMANAYRELYRSLINS